MVKPTATKPSAKATAPTKSLKSAIKGKGKQAPAPKVVQPSAESDDGSDEDDEEEDDESDWSSEDEDEENGGVSEKGMQRLMGLVSEADLDEEERAMLLQEDEEDSDDEDDESGEEDEEMDDESDEDEEESDEEEDGGIARKLDNSVLIDEADPDAVAMDDIGSNASLDEDSVPMRKLIINNKPALRAVTDALRVTSLAWPEHLVLSSKEVIDVDHDDDLQRETAFYKIALDQVAIAKKRAAKFDIPFSRPNDYYGEMVKSDEHMERIRTKLVEESQGIKKSEAAKKQRDLKKYGKQIQHEKIKQREMDKKSFTEKMQGVKRKRKDGMELGEDDEFGIQLDEEPEERGAGGGRGGRGGRGGKEKARIPRSARDAKYSLGGGGKRSKENTKESTESFPGWSAGRSGGRGGRGGRGGGRGGGGRGGSSGGRGGRGGSSSRGGAGGRPGKSRRDAGRT